MPCNGFTTSLAAHANILAEHVQLLRLSTGFVSGVAIRYSVLSFDQTAKCEYAICYLLVAFSRKSAGVPVYAYRTVLRLRLGPC